MPDSTNPRGRPRDESKDALILGVAAEQFERQGYRVTTTQAIAAAAGVGKQSIYRRWPTKADLALAVLRAQAEATIPTDAGLRVFLEQTGAALQRSGAVLRALMAEAQMDAALRNKLKSDLIQPRRDELAKVLRDLTAERREWAIAAVFGAVWYRLLLDEPIDQRLAEGLTELVYPRR